MGKNTFRLKTTVLAVCSALSCSAYAAHAVYTEEDLYVQDRDVPHALVHDYLTVTNFAEVTEPNHEYSGLLVGVHNRSGNPVRINWYGDMDGKNPQTGAINNGRIYGRLFINALKSGDTYEENPGTGVTTLKDYRSSVAPDGQANGIDAYGWVPVSNENDMTFALDKIENTGVVSGFAQLNTGEGTHRSLAVVNATANGVSLYGFGDYGKYIIGADGSEVAVDAATGGSRSARSVRSALAESDVNSIGEIPVALSPDDKNFYGKNVRVALDKLENSALIQGKLVVQGNEVSKAEADDYAQDYSLTSRSSGNGVSLQTVVTTQDRRTYSYDKKNEAALGDVNNTVGGRIAGDVQLAAVDVQNAGSTNYTRSVDSGNGISVAARTTRFGKNVTTASIGEVHNDGTITGRLVQQSGNNTAKRGSAATDINHTYSQVEAENGGNGIGIFVQAEQSVQGSADVEGIHADGATLTVGDITNKGRITGQADLHAGNGYDFIRMGGIDATGIIGVGNGISASFKTGSVPTTTYKIGKVNNSGVISGYLKAVAGQGVQQDNLTVPLEEVKLLVTDEKTYGTYNQAEVLPASIGNSNSGFCWSISCATASADTADAVTTIKASGNGLSFFANRLNSKQNGDTYEMGDIFNKGVISGYSEMYHGFQGTNYARVDFLATGIGIATDKEFKAEVNNLGIISGNHAALLAKAEISTANSFFNPDYLSGYREPINNYGVMAGTLIAANYQANDANSAGKYQQYQYFNADKDPVNNLGTLVYLKEGITKESKYSSAVRHAEAGTIDRIVVGSGGEVQLDDGMGNTATYTIVNGTVQDKDSSYTATASQLDHHIINGVGAKEGALVADKDLLLSHSVVNGFINGVSVKNDTSLTLDNTVVNTNGFAVKKSATDFYQHYAVKGDEHNNSLIIKNGSIVNGDIHLGAGDDKVVIADESVRINVTDHTLDLGDGKDELVLGENVTGAGASPIMVDYTIAGVNRLLVNQPSRIMANKMALPDDIELHNKLVYQASNNAATSLHSDEVLSPEISLANKTLKVGVRSPEDYGRLEVENANLNVEGAKLIVDSSLLDKTTVEQENWVLNDVVSVKRSIYQCGDMAVANQNCDGFNRNPEITDSFALKGEFSSVEDTSALFDFTDYHNGRDSAGNAVTGDDASYRKGLTLRVKRSALVEDIVNGTEDSFVDNTESLASNNVAEQPVASESSGTETEAAVVNNSSGMATEPAVANNTLGTSVNQSMVSNTASTGAESPIMIKINADTGLARLIDKIIDKAVQGDSASIELAKALGKLSNTEQVKQAVTQAAPVLYANTGNMLIEASRLLADHAPMGLAAQQFKDDTRDTYVWGHYVGAWGKHNADGDKSGYLGLASYKTQHNGLVLGATHYLDKGYLGLSAAYLASRAHTTDSIFNEKLTANTWQAGLYGERSLSSNFAVEGQVGYGRSSLKGTRHQSVLGLSTQGKYHADIAYASLGLRYYTGNEKYRISPFIRANYNFVRMDGFSEKGTATRLNVKKQNFNSLLLQAGIDGDFRLGDRWKLGGTLAIGVETLEKKPKIKTGFAVLPNQTTAINGLARPSVIGTAGVKAEFAPTATSAVTLRYNTNFGKKYIDQQVQLNLRMAF